MKKHFFFYWGRVSTAKEKNPAGSMMAADNQKVLIFFFSVYFLLRGFLAVSVSWDPNGSSGPEGICRMFDFCSTALQSTECLDSNSFARRAAPQGNLLCYPSSAWLTELASEHKQLRGF